MKLKLTTAALLLAGVAASTSAFANPTAHDAKTLQLSWSGVINPILTQDSFGFKILNAQGNETQAINTTVNLSRDASDNIQIPTTVTSVKLEAYKQGAATGASFTASKVEAVLAVKPTISGTGWMPNSSFDINGSNGQASNLDLSINGHKLSTSTPVVLSSAKVSTIDMPIAFGGKLLKADVNEAGGNINIAASLIISADLEA